MKYNKLRKYSIYPIIAFGILVSITQDAYAAVPSLKFEPSEIKAQLNQEIAVNIIVDTAGQDVGGVGTKIDYNPQYIQITSITNGTIFNDYPKSTFDNQQGKISISGIVSSPSNLYSGTDTFATINLKIIKPGASQLSFEFIPGETTDSNIAVTYGNGDILEDVSPLILTSSDPQGTNVASISNGEQPATTNVLNMFAVNMTQLIYIGIPVVAVLIIAGIILILKKRNQQTQPLNEQAPPLPEKFNTPNQTNSTLTQNDSPNNN